VGKAKKKADAPEKRKQGRPSEYREEYADEAYKLTLLGATDQELSDFFGVSLATLHTWKKVKPGFLDAIKNGKDRADANVAKSLYKRACGYDAPEERVTKDGIALVMTHHPPDTAAAFIWLKNRQRGRWRDRTDVGISGPDGGPIKLQVEFV
jgi:hypothetical protein